MMRALTLVPCVLVMTACLFKTTVQRVEPQDVTGGPRPMPSSQVERGTRSMLIVDWVSIDGQFIAVGGTLWPANAQLEAQPRVRRYCAERGWGSWTVARVESIPRHGVLRIRVDAETQPCEPVSQTTQGGAIQLELNALCVNAECEPLALLLRARSPSRWPEQ